MGDIYKATTPAALAEEYVVKKIWDNTYPPGSELPSERDLADKIGVTRTTLREVLQRLARDGWLTIQHGKATRVNNIWETSGLNILEVLMNLDATQVPSLIRHMLSVRTSMAMIYMTRALKVSPAQSLEVLQAQDQLIDTAKAFVDYDYELFRKLAFASKNPIYGLILNSLKSLYQRVGMPYFERPEARELARGFYQTLRELCEAGRAEDVAKAVREYGEQSAPIWHSLQEEMPQNFEDK